MIWRLLRAGELRPTRIMGRVLISESELQRLIQQNTDRGDAASDRLSNPIPDQSG
jgi:hypothetical protein